VLDRRRRESRSERAGRRSVACFEKAAASLPGLYSFLGAGNRAQPAASAPEIHRRRRVISGKRPGPTRRRSVAGVEKDAKARRAFSAWSPASQGLRNTLVNAGKLNQAGFMPT